MSGAGGFHLLGAGLDALDAGADQVLISLAASAERPGQERTSTPATTQSHGLARPRGRLQQTGVRAGMLVWKAMPSITPMMSLILRELSLMEPMVLTTCDTTSYTALGHAGGRAGELVGGHGGVGRLALVPVRVSYGRGRGPRLSCLLGATVLVAHGDFRSWRCRFPDAERTLPTRPRSSPLGRFEGVQQVMIAAASAGDAVVRSSRARVSAASMAYTRLPPEARRRLMSVAPPRRRPPRPAPGRRWSRFWWSLLRRARRSEP